MSRFRRLFMAILVTGAAGQQAAFPASPVVTDLKAAARNGQVFLTWKEAETPVGATFIVYKSSSPIADVSAAVKIAHHIERHSARDWWEDPASFKTDAKPAAPVGFLIETGRSRLDPAGGLFVDTVAEGEEGRAFYAVTVTAPDGKEDRRVVRGENTLSNPVPLKHQKPVPIWQHEGKPPLPGAGPVPGAAPGGARNGARAARIGAGKGKPLFLSLHAKGGVVANMEYLVFGDQTLGWRRGLPFKFGVRVTDTEVVVQPTDRVWINRPMLEAGDAGTPAVWTFWYGYNSHIYDRNRMGDGVPTNYTERRNLWILEWVRNHYQTDPDHGYVSGSSMGGCGSVSFGLRHPEIFAALHAHVPIVSYTYLGLSSAKRLEPSCWTGRITDAVKTDEGIPFLDRMNGTRLVREAESDLPFVFLINGRKDTSIPWENNPPFYKALNDTKRGFCAFWDDGIHSTSGKDAPDDVKAWTQRFRRFRLDESYLAFSNTSSNKNPGDGRPEDGDIVGWMNRGMDWKDIEDKPDLYAVTVLAAYPGLEYPVATDVTPRRLQRFKPKPGETLNVQIGAAKPVALKSDRRGVLTIPRVTIPSEKGVRLTVSR